MPKKCPLIKGVCLEHGCEWYTHLIGKNPQTGAQLDQWGCAVGWLPVLLIENSQETRQAAAAIEGQRNSVAALAVSAIGEAVERMAKSSPALPGDARGRIAKVN